MQGSLFGNPSSALFSIAEDKAAGIRVKICGKFKNLRANRHEYFYPSLKMRQEHPVRWICRALSGIYKPSSLSKYGSADMVRIRLRIIITVKIRRQANNLPIELHIPSSSLL